MKDFYLQCLEELESLTGIRQLFFLQSDPDGKKKIEVCIAGMVETSKRFPYIPDDEQQKIIREAMVTDQDYEALNSRIIYKWLNLHKDTYWGKSQKAQITEQELTPAPKEVADKYAEQWKEALQKIGNPEMKEKSIKDPIIQELSNRYPSTAGTRQRFIVGDVCNVCKGQGTIYEDVVGDGGSRMPIDCEECEGTGQINRVEVYATNQQEAEKAHRAIFN